MGALDVSSVRAKEAKEVSSLVLHREEEDASKKPMPKKKICCACPETKRLRDECIVQHGEAACSKWIQAHLECLRAEGFKVSEILTWKQESLNHILLSRMKSPALLFPIDEGSFGVVECEKY